MVSDGMRPCVRAEPSDCCGHVKDEQGGGDTRDCYASLPVLENVGLERRGRMHNEGIIIQDDGTLKTIS